jgi:hypothetical protein
VESRVNASEKAKAVLRKVTGSMRLSADWHDQTEGFVTVFSHRANDNDVGFP